MWGGDEGGERGWEGVREDSIYQLEKKDDSCTIIFQLTYEVAPPTGSE